MCNNILYLKKKKKIEIKIKISANSNKKYLKFLRYYKLINIKKGYPFSNNECKKKKKKFYFYFEFF